ncbi:MAG: hypothetical protein WCD16_12390 [Paracoccaceae bacterium]
MRRLLLSTALALAVAAPVFADETSGEIAAYDRVAGILVMKDKTIWTLAPDLVVPDGLGRGDKVNIVFNSDGENGIAVVTKIDRENG